MSDVTKKTVSIYIDQAASEAALEKLQNKADGFNKKIDEARQKQIALREEIKKLDDAGKSTTKLESQYKALEKEIVATTAKVNENAAAQRKLQENINNGVRPSLQQMENLVRQLRNELHLMSQDAPEFANKLANFQKANAQLTELRNNINGFEKAINGVEKAQKSWLKEAGGVAFGVLIGNTVQSALASLQSYISGIVSGNAKLSDSLADVQKSTGLSAAAVADLNSKLGKLDTRTPTEQLRQIAIGLGQINEAATPDNVAAIDKIVVALGDEFGGGAKEITNVLSVLRNNLADLKTGNYGDDVAHIGNALNTLGAEGLATAPVVTDIANRIAGVGQTFGLTSGQILGTAATFQELGIETERGSTAFIKIMQKMTAEPENFAVIAKAAGVATKEDFIDLLNNDMLQAFTKVAEGARIAGKDNVTFGKILKELDADGSGAGEVLSKLSKNEELLASKVKLASAALTNQNSITQEFNTKNTTFGAELDKLSKRFNSFISNSTLTSFFTSLVKGLNDVIQPTKSATQQFDELSKNIVHLQTDIVPLTIRYDELKGKTKLSADEQAEMKSIISQITSVIPGAVTEFDKYGNAIAISTDRVRDFIKVETARLKVVNRDAIQENTNRLKATNDQLLLQNRIIEEIKKTGTFTITETNAGGVSGGGATVTKRKATQEEIATAQEKYKQLLSDQTGYNAEVKRLNGNALQEQLEDAQKKAEVLRLLQGELLRLKKGTKEYEDLLNEINTIKGIAKQDDTTGGVADIIFPDEADKLAKKKAEALKNFQEFIKGIDESIQNNQIPNHTRPLIEALRKMYDELEKLGALKGEAGLSVEQVLDARAKILKEYQTFIQKFVDDEEKNFKKPLNESTIADGQLNTSSKPTVDLPLNISTEVTPEEEKALHEKLEKLQEKLKEQADLQLQLKEIRFQEVQEFLGFAQNAVGIISQLSDIQLAKEQRSLELELKANDKKKSAYDKQLKQRTISEVEYRRLVAQLDADSSKKKEELDRKQFENNKKQQIAQAAINGAMAITQIFATVPKFVPGTIIPNPLFPITLATAIATNLAEIGVIAAQKFALGGKVLPNGKITARQNIPTQPNGDNVLATVRTGEVILNEDQQRRAGGPDFFRRLGVPGFAFGGVVKPAYQTRSYQAIDFAGATRSLQTVRHYATGGLVTGSSNNASPAPTDPALLALLQTNQAAIENLHYTVAVLQQQLSKPIVAKADISLKKIDDAKAQQERIINEAAFR